MKDVNVQYAHLRAICFQRVSVGCFPLQDITVQDVPMRDLRLRNAYEPEVRVQDALAAICCCERCPCAGCPCPDSLDATFVRMRCPCSGRL